MARSIKITAIKISHANLDTLYSGGISSAPRLFQIYGLKDEQMIKLTEFEFDPRNGKSVFSVKNNGVFDSVLIAIDGNWGNDGWTCVYRVAVHGRELL